MRTTRRLVLKKETLTELTAVELRRIVGADPIELAVTTPVKHCVTELLTCYDTCMSWDTEQC